MRLNQFIAAASGLSRRAADTAISNGQVAVNNQPAHIGQQVGTHDQVRLSGTILQSPAQSTTIMLHKPVGYVCSRNGQGSPTVYDLLPAEFRQLKPVGRLDKDSSGLLLLTNDGQLTNNLTHPRYAKQKVYQVILDKPLSDVDKVTLQQGITIDDYTSRLELANIRDISLQVTLSQGRNRQVRRTFEALGYAVTALHRTQFGDYQLGGIPEGQWKRSES